jgi:hypothetical protein
MPAESKNPVVVRQRFVWGIVAVVLFAIRPSASIAQLSPQTAQVPASRQPSSADIEIPHTQNSVTGQKGKFTATQRDDVLEIPEHNGILEGDLSGPNSSGDEESEGTPYIGITVRDTVMRTLGPLGCYFPQNDVAGMEIETVDVGSPAAQAGLRGVRTGTKDYSLDGLLRKPSQLVDQSMATVDVYDTGGDLITEINGRRVFNTLDLNREFKAQKLKPGDTVYVTVIRRVRSWHSKTIKFPLRLGEWTRPQTVTIHDSPKS